MDAHLREAPGIFKRAPPGQIQTLDPKPDRLSGTATLTHRIRFQRFFSAAFHKFTQPRCRGGHVEDERRLQRAAWWEENKSFFFPPSEPQVEV